MRTVPPCGRKRGARRRYSPADGRFRERTRVRAHAWDAGIFFSVMLLLAIGLVALFSASYSTGYYNFKGDSLHFVTRQGMVAVAGVVAMIVISKVSYKLYARFYKPFLAVSVVLLILVAIPGIGTWYNGARRWLFGFQPSELAKLAVIGVLRVLDRARRAERAQL